LIAFLVVAACAGRQETTAPPGPQPEAPPAPAVVAPPPVAAPARVGLLVPLTGNAASLGQDLLDAAQLALFDVGRSDLELLPRDTGDSPPQAAAAARAALDAGAELLIGPLFGRSTTAVAPIAAERGVSVLSFSNDASIARPGVYVLGFRPEEQIERVVGFAAGQGLTRFAALGPNDAYGTRALTAWRTAVARQPGANATVAELYPADSDSPSAAVRQVAAFGREGGLPDAADEPGAASEAPAADVALPPPGFDALLVADGGARVSTIAALLAYYDVAPPTTRLLGTMRWQDDPALLSDAGLRGSWLATWPPDAVATFARRFATVYGREPAPLAVLAYDATALAALLAEGEPRFTPEQLTDPQGFVGGLGIFRLRPDGLAEHGLAVVETDSGGGRVVDPAPQVFGGGFAQR
jgi:ABC-type branched-subunit amino acid transport system substrate-binding protein